VSREAEAGPDPRGLHTTAGLLRTIEHELAVLKELKDTVENRLERIDTSLELLHSRIQAGPRERCAICKARFVTKSEPFPGGFCWRCWASSWDRSARVRTRARDGPEVLPGGMPR